jgi:hypothetical protein
VAPWRRHWSRTAVATGVCPILSRPTACPRPGPARRRPAHLPEQPTVQALWSGPRWRRWGTRRAYLTVWHPCGQTLSAPRCAQDVRQPQPDELALHVLYKRKVQRCVKSAL